MSYQAPIDKAIADIATLTGMVARLQQRVDALEARQIKAFGTDELRKNNDTLHMPARKQ